LNIGCDGESIAPCEIDSGNTRVFPHVEAETIWMWNETLLHPSTSLTLFSLYNKFAYDIKVLKIILTISDLKEKTFAKV